MNNIHSPDLFSFLHKPGLVFAVEPTTQTMRYSGLVQAREHHMQVHRVRHLLSILGNVDAERCSAVLPTALEWRKTSHLTRLAGAPLSGIHVRKPVLKSPCTDWPVGKFAGRSCTSIWQGARRRHLGSTSKTWREEDSVCHIQDGWICLSAHEVKH